VSLFRKDSRLFLLQSRLSLALVALLLLGCLSGCVRRRLTIRSDPPGAYVYVDDYPIGSTPVSSNFIYYGKRKIRLVKDGYETLTVMQSIPAPWYQFFPLDFVTENVIPGEIRDHRTITYQLTPQCVVPQDHLLGRAESLRSQVQAPRAMAVPPPYGSVPSGSVAPGMVPSTIGGPTEFSAQPEPLATPAPITSPPVTIPPDGASPVPGSATPTPPAWDAVPPATYPGVNEPQPPVGFGPRSAPPATQPSPGVQPSYLPPGYSQPGYSHPTYPQPGSGGTMVQPISPGGAGY
jgi:hypothetical protein